MNLISNIHRTVQFGAQLLRHHLLHDARDFQREWGGGEVFLRCQRCGLRSPGVQTGPPRLATRLPRHSERLRLEMPA